MEINDLCYWVDHINLGEPHDETFEVSEGTYKGLGMGDMHLVCPDGGTSRRVGLVFATYLDAAEWAKNACYRRSEHWRIQQKVWEGRIVARRCEGLK